MAAANKRRQGTASEAAGHGLKQTPARRHRSRLLPNVAQASRLSTFFKQTGNATVFCSHVFLSHREVQRSGGKVVGELTGVNSLDLVFDGKRWWIVNSG